MFTKIFMLPIQRPPQALITTVPLSQSPPTALVLGPAFLCADLEGILKHVICFKHFFNLGFQSLSSVTPSPSYPFHMSPPPLFPPPRLTPKLHPFLPPSTPSPSTPLPCPSLALFQSWSSFCHDLIPQNSRKQAGTCFFLPFLSNFNHLNLISDAFLLAARLTSGEAFRATGSAEGGRGGLGGREGST